MSSSIDEQIQDLKTQLGAKIIEDKINAINAIEASQKLKDALLGIQMIKPGDGSDKDRRCAIVISQLENTIAYCDYYIIGGE